jgi:Flp pilus assembly pilin Flp
MMEYAVIWAAIFGSSMLAGISVHIGKIAASLDRIADALDAERQP